MRTRFCSALRKRSDALDLIDIFNIAHPAYPGTCIKFWGQTPHLDSCDVGTPAYPHKYSRPAMSISTKPSSFVIMPATHDNGSHRAR